MPHVAGIRRLRAEMSDQINCEPVRDPRGPLEDHAANASARLAGIGRACETFYAVIAFLAYIGAALLIFFGVWYDFSIAPGIGLAVGITVSLLPMLMLCRWAQAYAADLAMRSADPTHSAGTSPNGVDSVRTQSPGLYGHKN